MSRVSPNMRITESGVLRSWDTLATKSDLSRAISVSRRASRQVATMPATMTSSNTPYRAARRRIRGLVDRQPPVGQRLAERHRQDRLGVGDRRATVHRAPLVVEHGEDGRRLEGAQRGLEDLATQRLGVTNERREHRLAAAPHEERETDPVAGDHLALATPLELALGRLCDERRDDRGVALRPRPRIEKLAAPGDQIEPANQRRAGERLG